MNRAGPLPAGALGSQMKIPFAIGQSIALGARRGSRKIGVRIGQVDSAMAPANRVARGVWLGGPGDSDYVFVGRLSDLVGVAPNVVGVADGCSPAARCHNDRGRHDGAHGRCRARYRSRLKRPTGIDPPSNGLLHGLDQAARAGRASSGEDACAGPKGSACLFGDWNQGETGEDLCRSYVSFLVLLADGTFAQMPSDREPDSLAQLRGSPSGRNLVQIGAIAPAPTQKQHRCH